MFSQDMSKRKGSMGGMGAIITPRTGVATLFFNGACRGNPTTAAIGFVLRDGNDRLIETFSRHLGYNLTNNVAEYKALIAGFQHALHNRITNIIAYGDSQLVCNHLNGQWPVTDDSLRRYYDAVLDLQRRFQVCRVVHVPREQNKEADALADHGILHKPVDERTNEIMERCRTPQGAIDYVLERRCEGFYQLCFILHIIKHHFPASYDAVEEQCRQIANQIGMNNANTCTACILVNY